MDADAPVLVTGASGYVASWIVKDLLEQGRTVRATVRDPDKASGLEHLHELSAAHPGKLTLHAADLLADGSFTVGMEGCQLVIHTASPFLVGKVKDPQEQLIRPALEGTRNVLASVDATPSVRRVVLTSSVAAIYGDNVEMRGRGPFTDQDWNTTSSETHQQYSYSKTVAERAAWEIAGKQDRWDLVTIHPGLVLGPSLTTASKSGSMTTMRHFVDFSLTFGAPGLTLGVVDVRDVAQAHVRAGDTPEATGRYIVNADTLSLLQIGRILRSAFGPRPSFPLFQAPKKVIELAAPAAGLTREFVKRNIGRPLAFDSSRTVRELGVAFRPARDSVVEHYQQMIDDGLAKGRARG
ncbi:NAD-dependent epimerase/dehydratase family protein [Patulibacter minatonensis]|uniref:NAD-dependent epimerase/dehydratase family protein n=1 Tax=Patulibacter minatonensis TaxID=298163 RepID=UPI00047BB901